VSMEEEGFNTREEAADTIASEDWQYLTIVECNGLWYVVERRIEPYLD
jgi:hypothetical protein